MTIDHGEFHPERLCHAAGVERAPKGWCPGLFEPMPAGDGLLVRVKPPGGSLTSTAARQLASAAAEFGNGTIELTNRANLQVRGLTADGAARFAAAMTEAGLTERHRAVICPPLAGADPAVVPHARTIAAEIEALLAGEPRLAGLPPKFVVAVDGGGVLPLGPTGADIIVVCTHKHCTVAPAGSPDAARVMAADAPAAVVRLALAFLELAGRTVPAPRRMRALIAALGWEPLFGAAGLDAVPEGAPTAPSRTIGWLPYDGAIRGAFGIGLPFGVATAEILVRLADVAEQFGDATLRLTPWRALTLPGIAAHDVPAVAAAASRLGLIVDADDPRSAIVTCAGRPGCANASVDVRTDAALLLGLRLAGPIHVSGCSKGCAHPAPASLTLVGDDGKYSIIRNGRARDMASVRRVTMAEAVAMLRPTGT